jgi:hypothetical protein
MKKTRYNPTVGKLLFVIPAILIVSLVVYAFVQLNAPGTLILQAESPSGSSLQVSVTVNGQAYTTPYTLSLHQGNYIANFSSIEWYYPPSTRDVTVTPGHTVYAVGLYNPIKKFVSVTGAGFNTTTISVLHGVTPVTWINPSDSLVTFTGSPLSQISLYPGQSFTYTFMTPGTYELTVLSTNLTLTVKVA